MNEVTKKTEDTTADTPVVEAPEPAVEEKAAKPESKPGDKDFDWATLYGTDELYVHTFPGGTVVALKPFSSIFSKTWLYKIRSLKTNVDVELAAIDRGSCPVARAVLEDLDDAEGDPIDDLWTAWSTSDTQNADGEGLSAGN